MKKIISVFLSLLCLTASLILPAQAEPAVRIAALKGPTGMGLVGLIRDDPNDYDVTLTGAVDEIAPLLLKGEADIAALPANLSANLYNKTGGQILALCVNTLGVLYLVENGDTVHGIADLKGRTIFASGKGATPEYTLTYLLAGNGLDPEKDVQLEFKSEHAECLAALMSTPGSVALLPQPFATVAQQKQQGIRIAVDLNEAWQELGNGELVTGVLVVRKAFAEEHPDLVNVFMDRYADSVRFVNESPAEAAKLIEELGILSADVAEIAIPYCRIVCYEGQQLLDSLPGYLQVLMAQNPDTIGGALPGEDFYYLRSGMAK